MYRAKLNQRDRLLFSIYEHQQQRYGLILEFVKNHEYQNSRFLRQAGEIDEDKIPLLSNADGQAVPTLPYLNPTQAHFNLLDKIISFDDYQHAVYELQPPLIVIGSAGSGKTALTLEKMKQAIGDVLYVTQSAYLVKNSRDLYYAHDYDNPDQQIDFLSFQEFLESIHVPEGKPVSFPAFQQWFNRFRQTNALKDAHKVFEEFRGVITGPATDKSWLSRNDYLQLGVKESIFLAEEREAVYDLFDKYVQFLRDNALYDTNIISHQYLERITPSYDFIVVDEVQDLTNVQLYLILKALRNNRDFILCGDSNQIVHPNFFSWSKVKSLFYKQQDLDTSEDLIRVLNTNYRNSPQVTDIANRILKIKNLRFGSIDKESHYLVESNGHQQGEVLFLQDTDGIRNELDSKTRASTLFAVIVMTAEQKPLAQQHFGTPLIFTIQEAKGLEYENIILYNFLSQEEARYREITKGVQASDLLSDLKYSRGKDKTDKSLEIYKFYINALYVALTRAVKNLYWIESNPKQSLLELIGLRDAQASLQLASQNSSLDAWRLEAHKLELQGKQEQADRIRSEILKQKTPPWQTITADTLPELKRKAFEANDKNARMELFEYALIYEDREILNRLLKLDFKPAKQPDKGMQLLQQKHYAIYSFKKPDPVIKQTQLYGTDFRNLFNQTPLMVAAWMGNSDVIQHLSVLGADTELVDGNGLTAFQIALNQAARNEAYAKKKLALIYQQLEPTSISIQVDGRLVKLDRHLMEFFLLNLMMAVFYRVMPDRVLRGKGFTSQDLLDAVAHIPNSVLPERRKQRAYLSSMLSKNEVNKDDKYNRKLFVRVRTGAYWFNPKLALKIEGEWVNIYDLLSIDRLTTMYVDGKDWWFVDLNSRYETMMKVAKQELKQKLGLSLQSTPNNGH
ncbi:UvrD-helicase domain-containing protein [Methylocucumis oryzae]|uniref:UvrD-helicase domain-containing protein n=1 Tax=Methylocucumis oryzae TaxID=1632867 RepID=UPI0019553B27|nr:UvrD-helicase domain-containing protein [Methylocucumis oryzae]